MEIYLAHAKSTGYFLPTKWSKVPLHVESASRIPPYSPGWVLNAQNSIHLTIWRYEYIKVPFGLMQASAYFQELMTGVLKDFSFTIAYLMTLSSSAEQQKNTLTTLCKFLKCYRMYTYWWNLANATSSLLLLFFTKET